MKSLPLFDDVAMPAQQHPIYRMICDGNYESERLLLRAWSEGFKDRDGKFCHEFQVSFEPCLWELYLHACLKEIGASVDFSHQSPDFVASRNEMFCIEATIAAPADGRPGPSNYSINDIPKDLNQFNSEATVRICNSFTSKVKLLRRKYAALPHCGDKPFILAIASFDRPFSHLTGVRPIISALYGLYHDEQATIQLRAHKILSYNVESVMKNDQVKIDLGYFCNSDFADVSAVIFSNLATWGKVRALAEHPKSLTVFQTFHPNPESLCPIVRSTPGVDYSEHLLDGLWILHNPFAKNKLDPATFDHQRIAQVYMKLDGEIEIVAPDDFLLMRNLISINTK
jgi:hypothetical protein